MGSRYRPPQRTGAFGGAEGQLRTRGNSRCGAARRAAAARSVLYPPARWRGSSVRPLPARYRREKRKKTKEKAERAVLALRTPAPRRRGPWSPVGRDPALFTWARRWRGSGARSGRGRVTRGPRTGAEHGGCGEPVQAGGDAPAPRYMQEHWRGSGGPENTEGVGYVYIAWLLPARTPRTRQRGTCGAARVRSEPCAGRDRRSAPGGGPYLPTRA